MGFKRIICDICKAEVNKAQTYHIGDGQRACKTHQGVVDKKEKLQQKELEEKSKVAAAQERKRQERFNSQDFQPGKLRCCVCHQYGMRSDSFFTRALVEQSKAEQIYGSYNPLDPSHPGNQVKIAERCIFVLGREKLGPVIHLIRGDFKHIFDLAGIAGVCDSCCRQNGIDPLPKFEFDDLMKVIPFTELFVKPIIDDIAKQEMSKEN